MQLPQRYQQQYKQQYRLAYTAQVGLFGGGMHIWQGGCCAGVNSRMGASAVAVCIVAAVLHGMLGSAGGSCDDSTGSSKGLPKSRGRYIRSSMRAWSVFNCAAACSCMGGGG